MAEEKACSEERLATSAELLGFFQLLPARFANRQLLVRFKTGGRVRPATGEECEALNLAHGTVVSLSAEYEPRPRPPATGAEVEDDLMLFGLGGGELRTTQGLYAAGEAAEQLLRLPAGRTVLAQAVTRFGVWYELQEQGEESVRVPRCYSGIVVAKLCPSPDAEPGAAPDPAT